MIERPGKVSWRGCSLSWVLTNRKEPAWEKKPRQRDSKCKGPAAGTGMLCVRHGRKVSEQSGVHGRTGDGGGEESRVSSLIFIAKQHSLKCSEIQHSSDARISFILWGIWLFCVWRKSYTQLKDWIFVFDFFFYLKNIKTSADFLRVIWKLLLCLCLYFVH